MSMDERIAARVAALTKKVGASITLVRKEMSSGPNPTVTSTKRATVIARVASFPEREIDGTLIKVGDILLFIPALGLSFAPAFRDSITFQGRSYEIVNVEPQFVSGSVALYRVHAR